MNEIIEKEEIKVENMIYDIRGKQVMLDKDLAMLYGYETKYLNRQVQRNIERFPENYCFQITAEENENLRCQILPQVQVLIMVVKDIIHMYLQSMELQAGILKNDIAVKNES